MFKRSFLTALVILLFFGCQNRVRHIAPNLCPTESDFFESLMITDEHTSHFKEQIQLTEYGHYLIGVYLTPQKDLVYTSIYEGKDGDSIYYNLERKLGPAIPLGEKMSWVNSAGNLYLRSPEHIIMIDYPVDLSDKIIPVQGQSEFFKLCE